jgi:hypothetical protein
MTSAEPVPAAPAPSTPEAPGPAQPQPQQQLPVAAVTTASGLPLALPRGTPGQFVAHPTLQATTESDAYRQLMRCFPRWSRVTEALSSDALRALSRNEPVDPNQTGTWIGRRTHAGAVLRRHGISKVDPYELTQEACDQLIERQAHADQQAGLDWITLAVPARLLEQPLRAAHTSLGIDLDDPEHWSGVRAKRAALARRLGIGGEQARELSRWAIAHPDLFAGDSLSCWQVGSATWFSLARPLISVPEKVERPVGVFLTPDERHPDGWRLGPVLSLELIGLVDSLGGHVASSLIAAEVPADRVEEFLERVNNRTLYAGERRLGESAAQLSEALQSALGRPLHPGLPNDRLERWGRLRVSTYSDGRLSMEVLTFTVKGFQTRRLGARRSRKREGYSYSVAMDLGEAVAFAVEREVPLLLSTEASGHLQGTVRVGRMKGRPGLLTITESDGMAAVTRRYVADQALGQLRELKAASANVVLDSGARQLVRMSVVRPLDDDPVLKEPQRRIAALKVVGSGLDMSQTATGKTITTGRAIYHRAATTARFRALIVASPRLLDQWREELTLGAPERGLPPLTPNCEVLILDERAPVGVQVRRFHRSLDDRAGVVLCGTGLMERFARELAVIHWHLGVVDEIHRYRNPATEAHRALAELRFTAVADFWGLTGTPTGKEVANLDRLVGLCVGDRTLLEERLNTSEAGDLMDEINAARLRLHYGPHAVRITKREMAPYLPKMLPAEPMPVEPDPALRALLHALREGGREAYVRLLEVLHRLKTLDKHSELHREAMKEFARVQGWVLGNVDRFVDAGVDPETLKHSTSLLAKTLVRDGLVDEAMQGGGDGLPLLRSIVAQTLAERSSEEQVLVFADRVWCLRQLTHTLRTRYGVETHVGDGSIPKAEFNTLKRRFTAGEFPILCLSAVGSEGHNLQVVSGIVHLDVPPVPDGLEQRVGRAERIGSPHAAIWTSIPYIVGAGTEHMVKIAAPRGSINHQILDAPEGVRAEDSTIAKQLGEITSQVAEHKQHEGYVATAARLRVAARIFGAR